MRTLLALVIDVVLILVFVAIGRASHAESLTPSGLLSTGWPFLAGLILGWLFARIWRDPVGLRRGLVVWVGCVAIGLLLRVALTDQTAQTPFVIVAALTTFILLLGWRFLARRRRRPPARRPAPQPASDRKAA